MKIQIIVFTLLLVVGLSGYFFSNKLYEPQNTETENTLVTNNENCTPTFRDGGGPYYNPNSPFREKIVPDKNNGESLIVGGKIFKNDCKTPISNAVLDIWQANETGNYEDEWYRGQIRSDSKGNYKFETVIPKGYGEGTSYRPPHIHFKVFIDNLEIVTSQMFFPEAKGKLGFDEAYIINVEIYNEDGEVNHIGTHNIVLP